MAITVDEKLSLEELCDSSHPRQLGSQMQKEMNGVQYLPHCFYLLVHFFVARQLTLILTKLNHN